MRWVCREVDQVIISVSCFSFLLLFSGTHPRLCSTAWSCKELELGQLRSGAVLHEDKKGETGCWDVSEATRSENCGLSATGLRWAFPQFLASNKLVNTSYTTVNLYEFSNLIWRPSSVSFNVLLANYFIKHFKTILDVQSCFKKLHLALSNEQFLLTQQRWPLWRTVRNTGMRTRTIKAWRKGRYLQSISPVMRVLLLFKNWTCKYAMIGQKAQKCNVLHARHMLKLWMLEKAGCSTVSVSHGLETG